MNLNHFLSVACLFVTIHAGAQMGSSPSNEEDDGGTLTPEFMMFLRDSGATTENTKAGFWREYQFAAFMSDRRRPVQYDSMVYYDSLRRYLRFYKLEGEYRDGKKEGEWITYVCFKKKLPLVWILDSKAMYIKGQRQGWEYVFNKDGLFVGKNYYKDDLQDSTSVFYYREGVISTATQYKKGKPHGKSVMYRPDGQTQFMITYHEGKRTGGIVYPADGNVPYMFGLQETYHTNGKLKSSGNYEHGELDGPYKTFYPDGSPAKEMRFSNGALDGPFKAYYDNGQLHHEWIYKEGRLWEVVCYFSKKGKPLPAGTLKEGSGTVITYTENGKQLTNVAYKNGVQQRTEDH